MSRLVLWLGLATALAGLHISPARTDPEDPNMEQTISLPYPRKQSHCSVEAALAARRSTRDFTARELTVDEVAQLLWAAQGITHGAGFRTAPSAGALYPLELYLAVDRVAGLNPGVYHYVPRSHRLTLNRQGDALPRLADAALGQTWVGESAAVLVITAAIRRTAAKYGPEAERYVAIEVGHAAQNVALEAVSLGLGTGFVGAFDGEEVAAALKLEPGKRPMYLLPLGIPEVPIRCGEQ